MSPIKEATTWPDAGIAIAGIGFITAVSLTLIWQLCLIVRSQWPNSGVQTGSNSSIQAQGDGLS